MIRNFDSKSPTLIRRNAFTCIMNRLIEDNER